MIPPDRNIKKLISDAILENDKKKYYVGKIILETANINPATYLGFGTWTYWGTGRVPVGVDINDIEFNTAEKTGGSKEITLTVSHLPNHRHTINPLYEQSTSSTFEMPETGFADRETSHTYYNKGATVKGYAGAFAGYTSSTGGGQPVNIEQQFITCYMWKRTA